MKVATLLRDFSDKAFSDLKKSLETATVTRDSLMGLADKAAVGKVAEWSIRGLQGAH